jgi:hypothetical protein|uniref:Uncharacterized protein n=1 Tax=Zea mays TaxID=4577 RepID=B4FI19_MAIZE|nr:unknown [Zea mays]
MGTGGGYGPAEAAMDWALSALSTVNKQINSLSALSRTGHWELWAEVRGRRGPATGGVPGGYGVSGRR